MNWACCGYHWNYAFTKGICFIYSFIYFLSFIYFFCEIFHTYARFGNWKLHYYSHILHDPEIHWTKFVYRILQSIKEKEYWLQPLTQFIWAECNYLHMALNSLPAHITTTLTSKWNWPKTLITCKKLMSLPKYVMIKVLYGNNLTKCRIILIFEILYVNHFSITRLYTYQWGCQVQLTDSL